MEIKIKWIKRKQMTHENTYRDDSIQILVSLECCFSWHISWKWCCVCLHMMSWFYEIDIGCIIVNEIDAILKLLTWARKYNILFHKNKTILLLFKSFSWKYFLLYSYLCWLYTSRFKCQRPHIFSLARLTREIVHQWYTVMRNSVLYYFYFIEGNATF